MSIATDDFIRSSGNLAYVNTWLKLIALVLLLVSLLLGAALLVKIVDGRTEHVVPIVINQAMGDAIPVDYRVVDAAGEERSPVEVRRFCEDFLTEAFTYNRYTVKTNLESIARWTAPEALTQVREALNLPRRAELIARNAQGLAELTSFLITENDILSQRGQEEAAQSFGDVARDLSMQTTGANAVDAHGLIVIEYRQSSFEKKSEGS